jgi:hypothetical protein
VSKKLLIAGQRFSLPELPDAEFITENISRCMASGEVFEISILVDDDPGKIVQLLVNGRALSHAAVIEDEA